MYICVQEVEIFFQASIPDLFEYTVVQTLTTELLFVCGNFVAAVSVATPKWLPSATGFLFEQSRFSLVMFLLSVTALSGGKFSDCISSQFIGAIF